jgi:hypothetical protein
MIGKGAREDVRATAGPSKMMLELKRRGVDLATRSMLRAVTKDLASLRELYDANPIFDLVAEDQMERIRPLLTPRLEYARSEPDRPNVRKASNTRPCAAPAVTRAGGGRVATAAHARRIEVSKETEEIERSRRLLAEQERSLHVQMELVRQEQIQRGLQQSQDVMSRLKISDVCDNRGALEVPFGHGAMGANAASRESFGQTGLSGGAGQMVSFPRVEQTPRASDLRSWFRKSGVEGEKLSHSSCEHAHRSSSRAPKTFKIFMRTENLRFCSHDGYCSTASSTRCE